MTINLLAEGFMEEVVAKKLLPFCGHELGAVYGKKGCAFVREKAVSFRHLATTETGLLVLTDFRDAKKECILEALHEYIFSKFSNPPNTYLCRFAVNELESWLLADREGLAKYLGISVAMMPLQPEREEYPKQALVGLARRSRRKAIRDGIAPPQGHRASVGPVYQGLMEEFICKYWNIENAALYAPSLARCIYRLQELV